MAPRIRTGKPTAFDSVALTFNSTAAPSLALANVMFSNTPVPELTIGLSCGIALRRSAGAPIKKHVFHARLCRQSMALSENLWML
jgi:hypothetical protein